MSRIKHEWEDEAYGPCSHLAIPYRRRILNVLRNIGYDTIEKVNSLVDHPEVLTRLMREPNFGVKSAEIMIKVMGWPKNTPLWFRSEPQRYFYTLQEGESLIRSNKYLTVRIRQAQEIIDYVIKWAEGRGELNEAEQLMVFRAREYQLFPEPPAYVKDSAGLEEGVFLDLVMKTES